MEWSRLRGGDGYLGDYEAFLKRRPDWPGLPYLKEKGEVAVARSDDPARVIAYFGKDKPQTGGGAVALIRAYDSAWPQERRGDRGVRAWTAAEVHRRGAGRVAGRA